MPYKFGKRSKKRMQGLHPDLIAVFELAIKRSDLDFTVIEGLRSLKTQKVYLAKGATTTLNSRHLTGHAIDVAPLVKGKVSWAWPLYYKLEPIIKQAAKDF